jgi:uncharacterized protein (DUF1499 family)
MTDLGPTADTPPKPVRQSKRAHALAIVGLVLIALSGPLAKAGVFSPMIGMLGFTIASLLLFIALIIAIRALLGNRKDNALQSTLTTWLVVLAGLGILGMNLSTINGSRGAPAIHDVTTDVANPPAFVAVVALREAGNAPNPHEYQNDGSAELQIVAFPEIKTIVVQESYDSAFAKAVSATEAMGWEIVANEPTEGRIEAVASTGYVGFKDDVVIRVRNNDNAITIDIRSKSRMGKGDMGANAARILAWTDLLLK